MTKGNAYVNCAQLLIGAVERIKLDSLARMSLEKKEGEKRRPTRKEDIHVLARLRFDT